MCSYFRIWDWLDGYTSCDFGLIYWGPLQWLMDILDMYVLRRLRTPRTDTESQIL